MIVFIVSLLLHAAALLFAAVLGMAVHDDADKTVILFAFALMTVAFLSAVSLQVAS